MAVPTDLTPEEQQRLQTLLEKIRPFLPDLLYQGSIQNKFTKSSRPAFVLAFRQDYTGPRNGRQKHIYIGKSEPLAAALMEEIWQRREAAHTRRRPRSISLRGPELSLPEYVAQRTLQDPSWADSPAGQSLRRILDQTQRPHAPQAQLVRCNTIHASTAIDQTSLAEQAVTTITAGDTSPVDLAPAPAQ